MNLTVNDIVEMKKPHPCGGDRMVVLRVGADIKLKCAFCGHEFMNPRSKIEKKIKRILS